ncbi:hypothetical protein AHAS_Ahas16G0197200 [Arachis hypogaea]
MRERERALARGGNTGTGRVHVVDKDPRVWNREEYRRLEHESFSIFVDNLPKDISKRELFHLFNWTGRINDIYLSRKYKNGDIYMFAFIRYTTRGGALKAMTEMNRMRLRGKVIMVQEAKYRRTSDTTYVKKGRVEDDQHHRSKPEPMREEDTERQLSNANELPPKETVRSTLCKSDTKNVEVAMVPGNLEWLQRSLVGATLEPINFNSLRKMLAIFLPSVVRVREMGACKALLTFDSVMSADEAYTFNLNFLLQTFHRVWKWNESERCESRRVWLECFGVPLAAWSADTFKLIGGQWGAVVTCAKETELCNTFTSGWVLIDTCVMNVIQERIHITVGSGGYDVLVKEGGCDVRDRQCQGSFTDNDAINGEILNSVINKPTSGTGVGPSRQLDSPNMDNQDDGLMMVVHRGEEEDKGRLVISSDILNEWNKCSANQNHGKSATYHSVNDCNQGIVVSDGENGASNEADSAKTVTCEYGLFYNGLEKSNGLTRTTIKENKKKKVFLKKAGLRRKYSFQMELGSQMGWASTGAGHDPDGEGGSVAVVGGSKLGWPSSNSGLDPVGKGDLLLLLPPAQRLTDLVDGTSFGGLDERGLGDADRGNRRAAAPERHLHRSDEIAGDGEAVGAGSATGKGIPFEQDVGQGTSGGAIQMVVDAAADGKGHEVEVEGELHAAQDPVCGATLGCGDQVVEACADRVNGGNRDDRGGSNGRSVESTGGTRQEQPDGEQDDGGNDS